MHSDHNAKEPGSFVWQSEHILMCSDDHIVTLPSPSGSAPSRFTHRHSLRIYQLYFSHPERPTHKCFTHLCGPSHRCQPSWGSFTQFYGHAPYDLTASHPTSDTICSKGRAWSPHPDLNPSLQGAKHALRRPRQRARLNGMAAREHIHL